VQGHQESNGIYEGYIQSYEKTSASLKLNLSGLIENVLAESATASAASPEASPPFASKVKERNEVLTQHVNTLKAKTEAAEKIIKDKRAKLDELKTKLNNLKSVDDMKAANSGLSERYDKLAIAVTDSGTKRDEMKKSAEEMTKKREELSESIGKIENKVEFVMSSLCKELSVLQENSISMKAAAAEAISKAESVVKAASAMKSKFNETNAVVFNIRQETETLEKTLKEAQLTYDNKKKELEAVNQALVIAKKDLDHCIKQAIDTEALEKEFKTNVNKVTRETSNFAKILMELESKACELVEIRSRIAQLNGHIAAQKHTNTLALKLHSNLINGNLLQFLRNISMRAIGIQQKFVKATIPRSLNLDETKNIKIKVHPATDTANVVLTTLGDFITAVSSIINSSPKVIRQCFAKDSSIETSFEGLTSLVEWTRTSISRTALTVGEIKKSIESLGTSSKSIESVLSPSSSQVQNSSNIAAEIASLKVKASSLGREATKAESSLHNETTRYNSKLEQAQTDLSNKMKSKKDEENKKKKMMKKKALAAESRLSEEADRAAKAAVSKASALKPTASSTPTMASVSTATESTKRMKRVGVTDDPEEVDNDIADDCSPSPSPQASAIISRKDKPRTIDHPSQFQHYPVQHQVQPAPRSIPINRKSQDVSSAPTTHTGGGGLEKKRRVGFEDQLVQVNPFTKLPKDDNEDNDSIADMMTSHHVPYGMRAAGGGGSPDGGEDNAERGRAEQQPQPVRQVHQQRPRASPFTYQVTITPAPPRHDILAVKKGTPSTMKIPTPSSTAPHTITAQKISAKNYSINDVFEDM
jgi:hypothetical protein